MNILEINQINTFYGKSHILHNTTLSIPADKIIVLLGRNGVGKTTLMRSIMGLTTARNGEILYKGEDITKKAPEDIAERGVGYVPQGRGVFPSLTVTEHLNVAMKKVQRNKNIKWTADEIYKVFPRLAERKKNLGSQLSGGEQQMLAISRALITNPEFIIMDEPTEGLAPVIVNGALNDLLILLKEKGYTVLLVEQNYKFAIKHADMTYVMSKGAIVYSGSPDEIDSNDEIKKTYLGI